MSTSLGFAIHSHSIVSLAFPFGKSILKNGCVSSVVMKKLTAQPGMSNLSFFQRVVGPIKFEIDIEFYSDTAEGTWAIERVIPHLGRGRYVRH